MEVLSYYCNLSNATPALLNLIDRLSKSSRSPGKTPIPAARPDRISPAVAAEVVARYEAGEGVSRIARTLGIHRYTVSRHLDEAGIARRSRSMNEEQIAQAVSLYDRGQSLATVGARLGFDDKTILKALRQQGTPRRDSHGRAKSGAPRGTSTP